MHCYLPTSPTLVPEHRLDRRLQRCSHVVCRVPRSFPGAGLFGSVEERSVGFVGHSDGWQDLSRNFQLTREYARAENGNIALTGEIDLADNEASSFRARLRRKLVRGGTTGSFQPTRSLHELRDYVSQWKDWQEGLKLHEPACDHDLYRASIAMLRVHESKDVLAASLPVCPSPGALTKVTKTWAVITWCGHVIWSKRPEAFSPRARRWTHCVLRISGVHAGSRRTLGAKYVARWPRLLDRIANGRSCFSDSLVDGIGRESPYRPW